MTESGGGAPPPAAWPFGPERPTEPPPPEQACQRCGTFAELERRGNRRLCATCLARLPYRGDGSPTTTVEMLRDAAHLARRTFVPAYLVAAATQLPLLIAVWIRGDELQEEVFRIYGAVVPLIVGGTLAVAALRISEDERPRWGAVFASVVTRWPSMVAAYAVYAVLAFAGLVLFVLPGLVVIVVLALGPVIPAVETRNPIRALQESAKRMKGYGLSYFLALVAIQVPCAVLLYLHNLAIDALVVFWPPYTPADATALFFGALDAFAFLIIYPVLDLPVRFLDAVVYVRTRPTAGGAG